MAKMNPRTSVSYSEKYLEWGLLQTVFLHYQKVPQGVCGLVKTQPCGTSVKVFANLKYNYVVHIF